MELSFERGDLLQLDPISNTETLRLLPPGKKRKVSTTIYISHCFAKVNSKNLSLVMIRAIWAVMNSRKASLWYVKFIFKSAFLCYALARLRISVVRGSNNKCCNWRCYSEEG